MKELYALFLEKKEFYKTYFLVFEVFAGGIVGKGKNNIKKIKMFMF